MERLASIIKSARVEPGTLAIYWLGQAGFAFKTSRDQIVYIDAYLSDMCETTLGGGVMSKRLIPSPIDPADINSGLMISTHMHQDHHDEESIAIVARSSPDVHFAGPRSVMESLKKLQVPPERAHLLNEQSPLRFGGINLKAVYADHGDFEPDAIGVLIETDGIRVYHTGDTCFCPERMGEVIGADPDVIIACINGTYGNLNAIEASRLAALVKAKVAIPSHFWFFIAQNTSVDGTPAAFIEACKAHAPCTKPVILTVGEPYLYRKD